MMNSCFSGTYRKCSSKHHTMLHIEPIPTMPLPPKHVDLQSQESSSAVLVTLSCHEKMSAANVLLATAMVLVNDQCGTYVPCRAILDSGSQLNLVTSQFINRLGLKCNRAFSTVSGIGDGNLVIDKLADLDVKSFYDGFSTSFTAMIVPNITN